MEMQLLALWLSLVNHQIDHHDFNIPIEAENLTEV